MLYTDQELKNTLLELEFGILLKCLRTKGSSERHSEEHDLPFKIKTAIDSVGILKDKTRHRLEAYYRDLNITQQQAAWLGQLIKQIRV